MRSVLLTFLLAVVFAEPLFGKRAAGTPDISGTWVLNVNKSKLAKGSGIKSETIVIECSASTVTMRDNVGGKLTTHTYFIDGKDHPLAEVHGGEVMVKAHWKKSTLVIETSGRVKTPNNPLSGSEAWHTEDKWSLSADGRVLTDKSTGFDTMTVSVYDKQ